MFSNGWNFIKKSLMLTGKDFKQVKILLKLNLLNNLNYERY